MLFCPRANTRPHWRALLLRWCMPGLLTGCAALPSASGAADIHHTCLRRASRIGVIDIGWHTGLILPADEMVGGLRSVAHYFAVKPRYWIFGWGNRQFYRAKNPNVWEGITALLPSQSILMIRAVEHLTVVTDLPGVRVWWLPTNPADDQRLAQYIAAFLSIKHTGRLTVVGSGPYPRSKFFASPGTYDAFHTCNTWTVTALKTAGFPVQPAGVIFAGQVVRQLKKLPVCE